MIDKNLKKNKLNNILVGRKEFKPVENTNVFNEAGRFGSFEQN